VFHQGLAEQTPLTIGMAVILVGALLLLAMLALREPIGVGTITNVIVVGLVLDAVLWIFDEPASVAIRITLTLTGPVVVAIGSGFYLGARLGPGPRDGLMTALGRRGITIWKAVSASRPLSSSAGCSLAARSAGARSGSSLSSARPSTSS
jgi:uncharacterized membrane protein YczE